MERVERIEDVEKGASVKAVRCRSCGGTPVVRWYCDDMENYGVVECRCGVKMPAEGSTRDSVIAGWNRMNADRFVPSGRPFFVGAPMLCATCLFRPRCSELEGKDDRYAMEFVCGDYVKEVWNGSRQ